MSTSAPRFARRRWRYCAVAIAACTLAFFRPASAADQRPVNGRCEWAAPGANPYMLGSDAAIDRLTDIPAATREKIKARMRLAAGADDHIIVTKQYVGSTQGAYQLWNMNSGRGAICYGSVRRDTWTPGMVERALIFTEDGYSVAWFSVCRNIAQAYRIPTPPAPPPKGPCCEPPPPPCCTPTTGPAGPAGPPGSSGPPGPAGPAGPPDIPGGSEVGDGGDTWLTISTPYNTYFQLYFGPGAPPPLPPLPPGGPDAPPVGPPPPVEPIPEPQTWALMMLGLALIAWARSRRHEHARQRASLHRNGT